MAAFTCCSGLRVCVPPPCVRQMHCGGSRCVVVPFNAWAAVGKAEHVVVQDNRERGILGSKEAHCRTKARSHAPACTASMAAQAVGMHTLTARTAPPRAGLSCTYATRGRRAWSCTTRPQLVTQGSSSFERDFSRTGSRTTSHPHSAPNGVAASKQVAGPHLLLLTSSAPSGKQAYQRHYSSTPWATHCRTCALSPHPALSSNCPAHVTSPHVRGLQTTRSSMASPPVLGFHRGTAMLLRVVCRVGRDVSWTVERTAREREREWERAQVPLYATCYHKSMPHATITKHMPSTWAPTCRLCALV